jgi:recombination protein RecA
MAGLEKQGKTTSALSLCANCQKPEYGNRPVMFLSVEHRLKSRDLLGIKGLKIEEPYFYFVESKKGKILSSIDFLNIGSTFLKNTPGGVLVVDSFSSLLSPKLLSDGLGASDFGKNNQYIAQFCESMAPIVKTNDNIVIGILQYYTNTSGYGKKFAEKTAKKLAYQADVQLQIKNSTPWTVGAKEDGELIGQYQDWIIKTSGIGKPGVVTSYIRYGIGIDKVQELFLLAVNLGLVEKGGAWYNFVYLDKEDMVGTEYEEKGEVKIQGEAKSNAALEEYPKWFEKLERKVKEFLGIKS